jgi:hypothetical protein
MVLDSTGRRRCLGVLVLVSALGLLLLGQTVLKDRLQGAGFVCYWMACLLLTGLAVVIALLDARAQLRRSLKEQHDLLSSTLENVRKEAKRRPRRK